MELLLTNKLDCEVEVQYCKIDRNSSGKSIEFAFLNSVTPILNICMSHLLP